jgi:hypothetical protein
MWVIIAKLNLNQHRDDLISDILETEKVQEPDLYLRKKAGYSKYNSTSNLSEALIYKQEASCKRLIKRFESTKKMNVVHRYDKFYYIKEYHLSYKKITREEWDVMCNNEISVLNRSYEYHKSTIEKKRNSFK